METGGISYHTGLNYMISCKYQHWLSWGLRWTLGGVFVWAGSLKMITPQVFADHIAAFQMLPDGLINLMALDLPPLELLSGILLIVGWQRYVAALSILLMSAVFFVALTWAWLRGLPVECGCFGDNFGSWGIGVAIIRDILFLLASASLYWKRTETYDSTSNQKKEKIPIDFPTS